jgi:hypothetical protein
VFTPLRTSGVRSIQVRRCHVSLAARCVAHRVTSRVCLSVWLCCHAADVGDSAAVTVATSQRDAVVVAGSIARRQSAAVAAGPWSLAAAAPRRQAVASFHEHNRRNRRPKRNVRVAARRR